MHILFLLMSDNHCFTCPCSLSTFINFIGSTSMLVLTYLELTLCLPCSVINLYSWYILYLFHVYWYYYCTQTTWILLLSHGDGGDISITYQLESSFHFLFQKLHYMFWPMKQKCSVTWLTGVNIWRVLCAIVFSLKFTLQNFDKLYLIECTGHVWSRNWKGLYA